ncbi:MAG: adenylate/guanylate cyclase domain-containing protein [Acidimicrobiales bacterium]
MSEGPQSYYARSADGTHLAYHVSGEGPNTLVVLGSGSPVPIDLLRDDPTFNRLTRRLSQFCRLVWSEARGWGASEGNRLDANVGRVFDTDLITVLDAVGAEQPTLMGPGPTASAAIRFTARHPERIGALILFNAHAHYVREVDYPWGFPRESLDRVEAFIRDTWGTEAMLEIVDPSRVGDERAESWFSRTTRVGGGPDEIAKSMRADYERDHRPLLPGITVPTLVLHREGNETPRIGAGRYLADHVPNAKFVALKGDQYALLTGDIDDFVDEIEEFLTGMRTGGAGELLTMTVLFTDIVASTENQAKLGQREWSRLTDQHDAMVRAALLAHRGREVKTTGDGFLATFDATGRALRCATNVLSAARTMGLELRAGVHTGEVEVRGDDIGGLAVSIAKRVCDSADANEVLVSESVRLSTVGLGIEFEDRGEHELKGVPGTWRLFALRG